MSHQGFLSKFETSKTNSAFIIKTQLELDFFHLNYKNADYYKLYCIKYGVDMLRDSFNFIIKKQIDTKMMALIVFENTYKWEMWSSTWQKDKNMLWIVL